ncbi:MAG: hypothetical protein WCI02_03660 [Planctomycetota bacterium]
MLGKVSLPWSRGLPTSLGLRPIVPALSPSAGTQSFGLPFRTLLTALLMDLMGILVWLAVLVSLVVFIVMVVKSAKGWGALHTTLLILLFLQVWCFLFFTAGVQSRRNGYVRAYDILKKKVEDRERELDEARYGSKIEPNVDLTRYVPITNELNRLLVERGRVWRNASVSVAGQNEIALQLPAVVQPAAGAANPANPPAAGNADAAAPAPVTADAGLPKDAIVHAFGESSDNNSILPVAYLGEFVVTDSANGIVKIKPTGALTPEQISAISQRSFGTWSVYELMPLDSHTAFATEGSKPEENATFGYMDPTALSNLLKIDMGLAQAEPASLNMKDAIKARVLQSYVNDGGRPPEGTPPEQVYVRVEFLKDHTIEVDAQEQRNAREGGFFDLSGRSVDARLKRAEDGAKVAFKAGETIVFDSSTANDLIKQEIVKSIAPVFVRSLNDYEYAFREVRRQITAAQQDAKLIEREIAEMLKSQGIADNQVRIRQDERAKLDKDFAQYKKENEVITAEAQRLQALVTATRTEISTMFQTIQSLRDEIVANQRSLTEAINARSGSGL